MRLHQKADKGFSLVELIIVIAIMAALVAILAPQYLKYVEKSRAAVCGTNLEGLRNAFYVEAAFAANNDFEANLQTVTDDNGYAFASKTVNDSLVKYYFDELCPSGGECYICVSKATGTVTELGCTKHGPDTYEHLSASDSSVGHLKDAFTAFIADQGGIPKSSNVYDSNGTNLTPRIKEALADLGYSVNENTMWKIVAKNATEFCIYMVDIPDDKAAELEANPNKVTLTGTQIYYKDGEVVKTVSDSNVTFRNTTANDSTYIIIANSSAYSAGNAP